MKIRYIVYSGKTYPKGKFYRMFYKAYTHAVCWIFCSKNTIFTVPGGNY